MSDSFHTPIVEIIRGSRASTYVHMAATRLSKAVRAAKGPFPLAKVAGIHPTFQGLDDDLEALRYLAEVATVTIASDGDGTFLAPFLPPSSNQGPKGRPRPEAGATPPPPSSPFRGQAFATAMRRLEVYVTDRITLEWTMPASVWPEHRRFTLRPAITAPSTKGLSPIEEQVLSRLCIGIPMTVEGLACALGCKARDRVEAVDTLVLRRLVVDADEVFHAHTLSLRWKQLCETVLERLPPSGPMPIRVLANLSWRDAGVKEVKCAVRCLEARRMVIVSQDGRDVSRFLPALRGVPPEASGSGKGRAGPEDPWCRGDPRGQRKGKGGKRHASPTNVVQDLVVLDWTAPLVGFPGSRTFVAAPVLESDALDGIPPEAEDVLETLRDYIPRNLARIETALGLGPMEGFLPLNALIARGAVVDGDGAGVAHDRSVAWQGLCGFVLMHCRGREPDDPSDMIGAVPGIGDPETAEAAALYLAVRGLLTRERENPDGEPAVDERQRAAHEAA